MAFKVLDSLAAFAAVLAGTTVARGQWTVTNLHPAGATTSQVLAVSADTVAKQVGYAQVGGVNRAVLWRGSAASWVDLHPIGASASFGQASSGSQEGGEAVIGGTRRASLWTGTSGSRLDLHPIGASASSVWAVSPSAQAGRVTFSAVTRAAIWSGSPGSWVDLNPVGATFSEVRAFGLASLAGSPVLQQAGAATLGGVNRASLWTGTAASWVDLNPSGASTSYAWAASGAQQAGYAIVGGVRRASLWSGTAASWVDLHPAGASSSEAYGASGSFQVGYALVGGTSRASLWSGTAASWVDLHALLPAWFTFSEALSIATDGTDIYVGGLGTNTVTGRTEALLWTRPLPRPRCVADVDDGTFTGTPDGGVEINDLVYYLGTFVGGLVAADVDDGTGTGTRDGGVGIEDLVYYLLRFELGC